MFIRQVIFQFIVYCDQTYFIQQHPIFYQIMQPQTPKIPQNTPKKQQRKKASLQDYQLLEKLGRGAYGEVRLVKKKDTGKKFALKFIEKKLLNREKKEYQAMVERQLLTKINHQGIIKISSSFQDDKRLYFVLELCQGGQFKEYLRLNYGRLDYSVISFYIGEIVNILEYLHKNNIVHRDLKPQNLMLSKNGHLKLIDFGTAQFSRSNIVSADFKQRINKQKKSNQQKIETALSKIGLELSKRKSTFVGTSFYLSPELLEHDICQPPSDLWALGCIIYQFYYGKTPFFDNQEFIIFEKIKQVNYQFPPDENVPEIAKDLIRKLLVKEPYQRLGSCQKQGYDYQALKRHEFFNKLDIDHLFSQKPPEVPQIQMNKTKQKQVYVHVKQQYDRRVTQQIEIKKEKEMVIYGLVQKKTFFIYKPIYLMFYKDCSIVTFKPQNMQKKKNLQLEDDNKQPAVWISEDKFSLSTKLKKYVFRIQESSKWVDQINACVQKKHKQKSK